MSDVKSETKALQLFSNSPLIYHPHYTDERRQQLRAFVKFSDGRITQMDMNTADKDSQFLRDIWAQHTTEEVLANTAKEQKFQEALAELSKRQEEDRRHEEQREALFQAKAEALKLAEITANPQSEVAMRIRKARTVTEVYSLSALAMMQAQKNL